MPKDRVIAAAIDLGSNSFRLLVGCRSDKGPQWLLKKRAPVQLGLAVAQRGIFTAECIDQALKALATFRAEMDRQGVTVLRCCGTEAFRRSTNPEVLTDPAGKVLGAPVEILDGYGEAKLCCLGVTSTLGGIPAYPCLIVDVGGGSTELILLRSAEDLPAVSSLPVGVITLATSEPVARALELTRLAESLRKLQVDAGISSRPKLVVATGGTAGCLAALDLELTDYAADRIQGHLLTRQRIAEIYGSLSSLSLRQRKVRKGLEAGREETIMPGLEIYQEILATIGCEGMMVSVAGLLEGILLSITRTARF